MIEKITSYAVQPVGAVQAPSLPAHLPHLPDESVPKVRNASALNYLLFEKTPVYSFKNAVSSEEASYYYENAANLLLSIDPASLSEGDIAEMKKNIDQAIALDSTNPGFYLMRGNILFLEAAKQNPFQPSREGVLLAIKDFSYSINLNGEFADHHFAAGDAFVLRGSSYFLIGEKEKAFDDLERAIAMDNATAMQLWELFQQVP